jgi:hypothetical protein
VPYRSLSDDSFKVCARIQARIKISPLGSNLLGVKLLSQLGQAQEC